MLTDGAAGLRAGRMITRSGNVGLGEAKSGKAGQVEAKVTEPTNNEAREWSGVIYQRY